MKGNKVKKHLTPMSVIYYQYYFRDNEGRDFRYDLRDFVKNFSNIMSVNFFHWVMEKDSSADSFLISQRGIDKNFYYFISTKNNNIQKVFNETGNADIKDVSDRLKNEQLGFASFLLIEKDYIAIASSSLSPKASSLKKVIDYLLEITQLGSNYKIILETFPFQTSTEEALKFSFIGSTIMKMDKNSVFFGKILQSIDSYSFSDSNDIDSLEIIIRPKRKKDITKTAKNIIKHSSEFNKLIISAKDEMQDKLTDYYILNATKTKDKVNIGSEATVYSEIIQAIDENDILRDELIKYRDRINERKVSKDIAIFNTTDGWRNIKLS